MRIDDIQKQAELAEMTNDNGLLSPLGWPSVDAWVPPSVEIDGDMLRWKIMEPGWPTAREPTGMLDRFLRIKNDGDILRFAKRWGPLRVLSHHVNRPETLEEPLSLWYDLVMQARALVAIGAAIRQRKTTPESAWRTLFPLPDGELAQHAKVMIARGTEPEAPRSIWFLIQPVIDDWIREGDVRPQVVPGWDPTSRGSSLQLTANNLGLLGLQVMNAITGANTITLCDACCEPYTPKRKPRRGQRQYCEKDECKREGHRLRQRAYQARKSQGE